MRDVTQPAATTPAPAEPTSQPTAVEPTTATPAATTPAPATDTAKPTEPGTLTLTQERLDQIISDRLGRAQQTWQQQQTEQQKRIAAALGITDPNAPVDPAKALEESQQQASSAQQMAHEAWAEALASQAGIKAERVEMFVKLVDLKAAMAAVNPGDKTAVRGAIKTAVDARAAEFPEWKTTTIPASSGGDRSGAASGEVTVEQFKAMSYADQVALYERDPQLFERLSNA